MSLLANTTAVILAGGKGSRLREVLPDTPKALAEINGKPFIKILLDRLTVFGLRRVVICTGHLGHMICEALGSTYKGINLVYSREPHLLGTAGALANARHLLPADPVLVINGDSYCHTDLEKFYVWFHNKQAEAAILLTYVKDTSRYGRVEIDSSEKIISFHEKTAKKGPGKINAGIYFINTALIEALPEQTACSLEKDVFPELAGISLAGFPTRDAFIDIGTKEAFRSAPDFFVKLDGRL